MNKELIKKYKAEFDHFINDGKLLYRSDRTDFRWTPVEYGSLFAANCNDVIDIIINDEYSEFRKALAEGKIVQYNPKCSIHDRWDDIPKGNSLSPTRAATLKNYRIKPDEPKFEVGDWIINTKPPYNFGKEPSKPFLVKQDWIDHIKKYGKTYGGNTANTGELDNFILWKPRPGELVCYGIDKDQLHVGRYSHQESDGHAIENISHLVYDIAPVVFDLSPYKDNS